MSRDEVEKRVKDDKEVYTDKFSEEAKSFCSKVSVFLVYWFLFSFFKLIGCFAG